jgi:hypothetical protein
VPFLSQNRRRSQNLTPTSEDEASPLVSHFNLPGRQTFNSNQFSGSGSGIRCIFDPLIRDPGWVKNQDPAWDEHSESLGTFFWVKILKFFDEDADPGIFLNLDPGWEKTDPGFGIKHPGSATLFLT